MMPVSLLWRFNHLFFLAIIIKKKSEGKSPKNVSLERFCVISTGQEVKGNLPGGIRELKNNLIAVYPFPTKLKLK